MKHDEFIGQVQHRARLSSRGDAEIATRATLETLAERLSGGEADDLASQLPRGIAEDLRTEFAVLYGAVSPGEMADVRAQLPADYARLFEPEREEAW